MKRERSDFTAKITVPTNKGYNVEELKTEDELEETEEMDPEPKKKAPARKTTKEG